MGEYTDISNIVTTLIQGEEQVVIEQDCDEYLDPLSTWLDQYMALGISVYDAGVDNSINHD